jgi:hypothetical protein
MNRNVDVLSSYVYDDDVRILRFYAADDDDDDDDGVYEADQNVCVR